MMKSQQCYISFIEEEHQKYTTGFITKEEQTSFIADLRKLRNFCLSPLIGPDQLYQEVKSYEKQSTTIANNSPASLAN